jgi:surface carbohydrate biosynthesis protein
LQWEQIYSQSDYEKGIASTTGKALMCSHICWGEKTRERLMLEGVSPDKTFIAGAIHLDFCREEFNTYYHNKDYISSKFGLDKNKQWVLFISSFAFATYKIQSLSKLYEQWGDFSDFVDIHRESRKLFLEWVENLIQENPNIEFIYRPHPSENSDELLEYFEDTIDQFHVINDFSVKQWIKVSDCIVTWYSTSIAEIIAMNRSFHIVRPIPIPQKYELEILNEANFIETSDDFVKTICSSRDNKLPIDESIFKEYYNIDDEPAFIKVANILIGVLKTEQFDYLKSFKNTNTEHQFKNKYRKEVVISLLAEFLMKSKIRISKFIPYRRDILENIEQYSESFPHSYISEVESRINNYFSQHHKDIIGENNHKWR